MNVELEAVFAAMRRTLARDVLPALPAQSHAAGQLAAIDDILGKLAGMTTWSDADLRAQAQVLASAHAEVLARARAAGIAVDAELAPAPEAAQDLALAQAGMCRLIDWLDARHDTLPPAMWQALDGQVRLALREQLRLDRRRIPLTDFSAMVGTSPTTGDKTAC